MLPWQHVIRVLADGREAIMRQDAVSAQVQAELKADAMLASMPAERTDPGYVNWQLRMQESKRWQNWPHS